MSAPLSALEMKSRLVWLTFPSKLSALGGATIARTSSHGTHRAPVSSRSSIRISSLPSHTSLTTTYKSPTPNRKPCEWRSETTPPPLDSEAAIPVSSRTSRATVSAKSSPGSASPPTGRGTTGRAERWPERSPSGVRATPARQFPAALHPRRRRDALLHHQHMARGVDDDAADADLGEGVGGKRARLVGRKPAGHLDVPWLGVVELEALRRRRAHKGGAFQRDLEPEPSLARGGPLLNPAAELDAERVRRVRGRNRYLNLDAAVPILPR
mmetsp:Transcript_45520/g.147938  ORF Transcript_45520/g.147938 Transcript_45520/m.147938 type:complete len:269 (-) Transcript_45520:177-983(-)